MPAWMTRCCCALVTVPNAFSAPITITSRPACASARARQPDHSGANDDAIDSFAWHGGIVGAAAQATAPRRGGFTRRQPVAIDNACVTDVPTQLLRVCPQCSLAMAHLTLPSHGAQPVVVDQCASCRLVWFDALESVQLSGLGQVRLLRELQRGARGDRRRRGRRRWLARSCHATLKPVHNATRFGRFPRSSAPRATATCTATAASLAERGPGAAAARPRAPRSHRGTAHDPMPELRCRLRRRR